MHKKSVLLTCLAIFFLILGWDAYLYLDGIPGNSITQSVIAVSKVYPILPWGIGFLMGGLTFHFFDPEAQ